MTERPIGYYVHHHGAGHLVRARAIARAAADRVVLLGTGIGLLGVDLADDRPASGAFDGVDSSVCRPETLHYAPLDHAGIRSRTATIARWVETQKPALMVVDVSVEVAMLARLASVPVVYVRLNGDRNDAAHLDAFRGAIGLLSPFHADLDAPTTLPWVREKTRYLPGITTTRRSGSGDDRSVLVVMGRGGEPGDGEVLARAARACPAWRWRVIGPCSAVGPMPANLEILGWVQSPDQVIADATIVVGASGDGLVGSILAADRPFICIPQDRPFDEQRATARRLDEVGAALMLSIWPEPEQWPGLLDKALALRPQTRRRLHDANGARGAAAWIAALADTCADAQEQAA
jgi:UDP-N-acetylglucosamine transferase subunit ALG13